LRRFHISKSGVGLLLSLMAHNVFGVDWQSAINELLKPEKVQVLRGWNLAVVAPDDPLSKEFGSAFIESLKKNGLKVVYTDNTVIQKEIDRQFSGMVDDKYIKAVGHQYGAEISIQLLITRNMDIENQVKIQMKAANVETNSVMAVGVTKVVVPSTAANYYDISLEAGTETDETKRATLAFLEGKVSAVYDVVEKPRKEFKLPKLPEIDPDCNYVGVYLPLNYGAGTKSYSSHGIGWIGFDASAYNFHLSLSIEDGFRWTNLRMGGIVRYWNVPIIGNVGFVIGGEIGGSWGDQHGGPVFCLGPYCGFISKFFNIYVEPGLFLPLLYDSGDNNPLGINFSVGFGYKWEL